MTARSLFTDPEGEWRTRAACRGLDPELFYGDVGITSYDEAKAVCAGCPVRQECLDHALATHEKEGVWGGLSPKERRRVRRKQLAATLDARRSA